LPYRLTYSLLHFASKKIASMNGAQPSVIVTHSFVLARNFATSTTDAERCTNHATKQVLKDARITRPNRCTVLFSPEMIASFLQIDPTTDEIRQF
ncbi:hypothetical protein WUBG_07456, partial [Wuchereria bancrofti]